MHTHTHTKSIATKESDHATVPLDLLIKNKCRKLPDTHKDARHQIFIMVNTPLHKRTLKVYCAEWSWLKASI